MSGTGSVVHVGAVQQAPVFLDRAASVDKACELIAAAASEGADLVVFPEAFIAAYPDWVWLVPNSHAAMLGSLYGELVENAVSVPDDSTRRLGQAARAGGVHVAIGVSERNVEASGGSLFNTLLYFSADGTLAGAHRKLVPTGGERTVWAPGDGSSLVGVTTPLGRLGGLICWENFMPLARNAMYRLGTQIHVAPTWDSSEAWQVAMRYIAREGGMFVVSCCQALRRDDIPERYEFRDLYPEGREWINRGNSCVVDPMGRVIAGPLAEAQEILYAELDLGLIPKAKRSFDVAGHYDRTDVFRFDVRRD